MWLQHFTSLRRVLALAALLSLAACASGPSQAPSSAAKKADAEAGGERIVPPQAQTLYEQAASAMAAGDLIDAELRFKEFLLQFPDFPGAHVNISIIHAENGNMDAARAAVDAALGIDPEYAPALNQSGVLLRKNGNFSEAEAAYLKAVTVAPDYPLAHYNLGVLNELYFQRLDAALRHFERYKELVGEDEQVSRWIVDLQRRVAASQRTANMTE